MEELIYFEEELRKAGYKDDDSIFFSNGFTLLYIHPTDGVYVAFTKGFDRWAVDRLNDVALAIPYTKEQLKTFFEELSNILNADYV